MPSIPTFAALHARVAVHKCASAHDPRHQNSMSEQSSQNQLYSRRPETPLGEAYGLTSAPVSQQQSRRGSPPIDCYQYQPAMTWTHPQAFPKRTHNYTDALTNLISSAESTPSNETTTPKSGPVGNEKSENGADRSAVEQNNIREDKA